MANARALGARDRWFESSRPEKNNNLERPAEGGASEQSNVSQFSKCLNWSQLLNEARTFFEQKMLD